MTGHIVNFANEGGKLLSFDVFDTVLLRNQKSEIRRFYEMAKLFASAASAEFDIQPDAVGALFARLASTRNSYRFSSPVEGCREGRLEEIHLGRSYAEPSRQLFKCAYKVGTRLRTAESLPNPLIQAMLGAADDAGLQVVLISDMYMGKLHIADFLRPTFLAAFMCARFSPVVIIRSARLSGRLFRHVAKECRIDPTLCLHVGDNLTTDYLCARKQGWQALSSAYR